MNHRDQRDGKLKVINNQNIKPTLKRYEPPTLIKIGKLQKVTQKFGSFLDVYGYDTGQQQL